MQVLHMPLEEIHSFQLDLSKSLAQALCKGKNKNESSGAITRARTLLPTNNINAIDGVDKKKQQYFSNISLGWTESLDSEDIKAELSRLYNVGVSITHYLLSPLQLRSNEANPICHWGGKFNALISLCDYLIEQEKRFSQRHLIRYCKRSLTHQGFLPEAVLRKLCTSVNRGFYWLYDDYLQDIRSHLKNELTMAMEKRLWRLLILDQTLNTHEHLGLASNIYKTSFYAFALMVIPVCQTKAANTEISAMSYSRWIYQFSRFARHIDDIADLLEDVIAHEANTFIESRKATTSNIPTIVDELVTDYRKIVSFQTSHASSSQHQNFLRNLTLSWLGFDTQEISRRN